jgi:CTP:molybdopterin cytidylyltransferase MocA
MTTAVVILAAGGSRRLGSPKQALTIDGVSFLERACLTALAIEPFEVIAVLGCQAEVLCRLVPLGVRVVVNPDWESGLASSIGAGIRGLSEAADVCVLTLVDQPLVTEDHLRCLIEAVSNGSAAAGSIYPDGHLGVPAAFHRGLFTELASLDGDAGAKRLLERPETVGVAGADLTDIDTQGDLLNLRAVSGD